MRKHTLLVVTLLLAACGTQSTPPRVTLNVSCGSGTYSTPQCKESAQRWSQITGHTVNVTGDTNLASYIQRLSSKTTEMDVLNVSQFWIPLLGPHLLDLSKSVNAATNEHFAVLLKAFTQKNQLLALPLFADAGLLYYRTDLLQKYGFSQPPQTWQELQHQAETILAGEQSNTLQGLVYAGQKDENLTVTALEWLGSQGAGTIVDEQGNITVNNPNAVQVLQQARGWMNNITRLDSTTFNGEDARKVFQSGNAIFMRNWPYAYSLLQGQDSPLKGKVAVVVPPGGTATAPQVSVAAATGLAVNKYSKHPDLAAQLAAFMTSAQEQKTRALEAAYNPTIKSLYQDSSVLQVSAVMPPLAQSFERALLSPLPVTGLKYNQVSEAFSSAVHDVLTGKQTAQDALAALEVKLQTIKGKGW